jgi:hypothetical protein
LAPPRRTKTRSKKSESGRSLGNVDSNIKKSARKYDKPDWVSIPDGESVIGRIVDVGDDFKDGFVHQVPFKGSGGKTYTRDVMCLDQDDDGSPCPGCADDVDRRYKFWTRFILRDCERVNARGKTIGYEDKVVILSSGKRMVSAINKKNKRYDLSLHDIEIEREGEGFESQYEVEVLDEGDPSELSKADKNLIENSTVDLARYTTPPEFDDFYSTGNDRDDDDDVGEKSKRRGSSFGSRKSSSSKKRDDDDDDDDEPVRKSKKSSGALGSIKTSKSSSKRRRR